MTLPEDEVIERMIEIEKMLMRLANNSQGNSALFDAIIDAQCVLHRAVYKMPKPKL
jgi:hypothetical protein